MAFRKRRAIGVGCLGLLAILLAAAIYYYIRQQRMTSELQDLVAALDESEPGWRLADLYQKGLDIPAEENSAVLILKLKPLVPRDWRKQDEELDWAEVLPGDPLTAKQEATIRARVGRLEGALPEARKLIERPRGRFKITPAADMISTLLPHLEDVRAAADMLAHDVYWRVHLGQYDEALASCQAGVNVARSLDDEPILISQLVHGTTMNLAVRGVQHTLASGEPGAAALDKLQKSLEDANRQDAFEVSIRGERAAMHELFTNMTNGTVSFGQIVKLMGGRGSTGIQDTAQEFAMMTSARASHIWMLMHFNAALEAGRLPAARQDAQMKQLQQAPISAPMLAKFLAPAWVKCHEAFRRNETRLRCAIVAVALERYRRKHGEWPADLAALMPEFLGKMPRDPYTGEALHYRQTANGVVVFSGGPDGKQAGDFYDKAQPAGPAAAPGGPDMGEYYEFRLWDPPLRGVPVVQRARKP
jgi:hypothetical protein